MKNYFGYTRVSTVRQGEHGVSLVEQKSAIEAYAARNGLTIIKWFGEMETASKRGRPQFSQMLRELRIGRADGMIVHKIDRSSRNHRDWADINELVDRGIDVRFVSENLDLSSTSGRFSADIHAVMSAGYSRNLRDEVKKGMWGRLKQGIYPWQAPKGYLDQGGGKPKIIDPVAGPLVRHLFERYGSNTVSLRTLGQEMFARGLKTKAGTVLCANRLSDILRNPYYCGLLRVKTTSEIFPGSHEPLISKDLWQRVQDIMDGKAVPKARKHHFLFRKMIHCENCRRRTLTGETHKGFTYYRCHDEACRGLSWSEAQLEVRVFQEICRIRFDFDGHKSKYSPDNPAQSRGCGDVGMRSEPEGSPSLVDTSGGAYRDLAAIAKDLYRDQEADRGRLRKSLQLRLDQIDARTNKMTDLLIEDAIDRDTYATRKEELLLERRGAEEELQALSMDSPFLRLVEMFERNNRELLRYELMTDDEKRELLEIICSNFSASRESLAFTLHSPYREIAEDADPRYCGHHRYDVRTERILGILKDCSERPIDLRKDGAIAGSSVM